MRNLLLILVGDAVLCYFWRFPDDSVVDHLAEGGREKRPVRMSQRKSEDAAGELVCQRE